MRVVAIAVLSILSFAAAPALASGTPSSPGGTHTIKGHVTKKGTYVAPSIAKNPDHSKTNNFSSRGNYNPLTGNRGIKK